MTICNESRPKVAAIKRELRRTTELTYEETLADLYAEHGNPLVNAALAELTDEDGE
jgi:hypothetical protein